MEMALPRGPGGKFAPRRPRLAVVPVVAADDPPAVQTVAAEPLPPVATPDRAIELPAAYAGLEAFAELASSNGTTIADTLAYYLDLDRALQDDPRTGLLRVAINAGCTHEQAATIFADLARDLGPPAAPLAVLGADAAPDHITPGAMEAFARDPRHSRFPELRSIMGKLFGEGLIPLTGDPVADLRAAYRLAAWKHPAPTF